MCGGGTCHKRAIFRLDWHAAKTQPNCCLLHITACLLIICPPRLRQDFILFFFTKLLFFSCLIRSFTSFFPLFLHGTHLKELQEYMKQTEDSHHGSVNSLLALRWLLRDGVISAGAGRELALICVRGAGGCNQEKNRENLFSCSAGIFKRDNCSDSQTQRSTNAVVYTQITLALVPGQATRFASAAVRVSQYLFLLSLQPDV